MFMYACVYVCFACTYTYKLAEIGWVGVGRSKFTTL